MRGLVLFCWLPAFTLFVALPASPQAKHAFPSAAPAADNLAADVPVNVPSEAPVTPSLPALSSEESGDIHFARQEYQAAIRFYAAVAVPSAAVWNKMGIAYQMLFDMKDAARCYKESIKLDPVNFRALNNLATVEESLQELGAAERYYKKALKLDPRAAQIIKNLGTNLLMQHQYGRGADAYAQALAIDPHIFDPSSGPSIDLPSPKIERGTESYFQALSCARAQLADCAISHLRDAFNQGSATVKRVANDYDFASLQGIPAFDKLLAEHR
jgi:tetratricopeptide (TPR) repeat protein